MADLELIALLTARLKQLEARLPNTVTQAAESALKSWADDNRESLQGKSADPVTVDDIRAVVMPWLAENITQPKDGNDADPVNMADVAEIVNTWLTVHYADLLPSHAVIENIATTWLSANIKQPKDGNNATIGQIRTVAELWLRANISQPKDGDDGESPEHEWNGSLLRFKNPDGTWGKWVNLRGERGFGGGGSKGVGVPLGGTTGQVLAKTSNTDLDTQWIDPPEGGGDSLLSLPVAGNIIAYKTVTTDADGLVIYGDAGTVAHWNSILGIALNSASAGGHVAIAQYGLVTNAGWNWTAGDALFVGLNGDITTQQVGVFSQNIGYAVSATQIFLRLGRAIVRS